jgi:NarL family two-component system response regulator LiaR
VPHVRGGLEAELTGGITVLVADDHPLVRRGLQTFLELQDDLELVGEAADGEEAVAKAERLRPQVVLMDVVMPRLGGIDAIRRIREASPATSVIVLTSFVDDEKVVQAVRAGAAGYLLKDMEPREVAEAIRRVSRGESLLHPAVAAKLMQEVARTGRRSAADVLTARELEVLRLLARGLSNKAIARELTVTEKTVKTHVSNILSKLDLTDRTQAALYAVREHLVELD